MEVEMRRIGFIGSEKYDIILYLSELLIKLGNRVLLVDYSSEKALKSCIPFTEHLTECNFRGASFLDAPQTLTDNDLMEYDYVLIDFGFMRKHEMVNKCDEMYFVTDLQIHNVLRVKDTTISNSIPRYFILRNTNDGRRFVSVAIENLRSLYAVKDNVFIIENDQVTDQRKLECQYRKTITLKGVSSEIKDLITMMVADVFGDREIKAALRKMER
jgi:hypothetical protein